MCANKNNQHHNRPPALPLPLMVKVAILTLPDYLYATSVPVIYHVSLISCVFVIHRS